MKEPDFDSIKPCPKCGGKGYLDREFFIYSGKGARIKCYDCGFRTDWEFGGINIDLANLAIKRWNEIPKEYQITQMALFSENAL